MSDRTEIPDVIGLALIGYRGTGKTTVGRLLAATLGRSFVDADQALESRIGRSIRSLFENEGEPVFRDLEEKILADLSRHPDRAVVATGGGVILRAANRNALKAFGLTIWLRADPTVLADRLRGGLDRPALTSAGTLREIADVLETREPLYRAAADLVIETDQKRPVEIVDELRSVLGQIDAERWRAIEQRRRTDR